MKVIRGDITEFEGDAIVNAANTSLLGGGGVDGAIHRAAGPKLVEECSRLNGCKTGEAKITSAYNLPCNYVIHTVGPVWNKGGVEKEKLLAACYQNSLNIAIDHDEILSVAFPCISTGIYGFPADLAAEIAVSTCADYAEKLAITFCCFSRADFARYQKLGISANCAD